MDNFLGDFTKKFLENQRNIEPFKYYDFYRIGLLFLEFCTSEKKAYSNYTPLNKVDISNISSILFDIIQLLKTNRFVLISTPSPSQCYHLISPIQSANDDQSFNKETKDVFPIPPRIDDIIFATRSSNFMSQLDRLQKLEIKNDDMDSVHFIVHPENLEEEEFSNLRSYLNSRLEHKGEKKYPKLCVISSIQSHDPKYPKKDINQEDIKKFKDLTISIREQSYIDNQHKYKLYVSPQSGCGKTRKIIEDNGKNNTLVNHFIDLTVKSIPRFEDNKNNIHITISEDLNSNNFDFFDQFYILSQLGYIFYPNGSSMLVDPSNSSTFYFEIPISSKKFKVENFPIAIKNEDYINVSPNGKNNED